MSLGAFEFVVGRCGCQLLFQWATRTTMWDMGPKKSKAHMGHLVQLKESMCQSHGLGFLILTILQHIHSFGCKSFFWVLDIQNPCRMNAIWGLLLVGLVVTMEGSSFVIWSHIWTNVHHVFLWTVECNFLGELHGTAHIAIVVTYCLKFVIAIMGRSIHFMCYKWQATIYILLRYGFVCIASSLRVRA